MINPLTTNTITGKPSSFHCGPEIQQMKLKQNTMKNPNGRRQTGWLYTSSAEELTIDHRAHIQLVVWAGLELGISRSQVQRPNHLATVLTTLPWAKFKRIVVLVGLINMNTKEYKIQKDAAAI